MAKIALFYLLDPAKAKLPENFGIKLAADNLIHGFDSVMRDWCSELLCSFAGLGGDRSNLSPATLKEPTVEVSGRISRRAGASRIGTVEACSGAGPYSKAGPRSVPFGTKPLDIMLYSPA